MMIGGNLTSEPAVMNDDVVKREHQNTSLSDVVAWATTSQPENS
jgi:hypothetical protein